MIDYFAIGLTHGLLMLAFLRLLRRDDLDKDPESSEPGSGPVSGPGPARSADPVYRTQAPVPERKG